MKGFGILFSLKKFFINQIKLTDFKLCSNLLREDSLLSLSQTYLLQQNIIFVVAPLWFLFCPQTKHLLFCFPVGKITPVITSPFSIHMLEISKLSDLQKSLPSKRKCVPGRVASLTVVFLKI